MWRSPCTVTCRAATAARHRGSGNDRRRPRPRRRWRRLRTRSADYPGVRARRKSAARCLVVRRQRRRQLDRRSADRRQGFTTGSSITRRLPRRRWPAWSTSPAIRRRASKTSSSAPRFASSAKACRGPAFGAAIRDEAAQRVQRKRTGPRHHRLLFSSARRPRPCSRFASSATSASAFSAIRRAGDRQNDVLTYGLSFARAITQRAELVGEVYGRGKHARRGAAARDRFTQHPSLRGAVHDGPGSGRRRGARRASRTRPGWGVTAGFTYVFNAFQVP